MAWVTKTSAGEKNTEFGRFFERTLQEEGIKSEYEPARFPLVVEGRRFTYTPDYFLDRTRNNRRIIVEVHGEIGSNGNQFNDSFFEKMVAFKQTTVSDLYHLLLVSDISPDRLARLLKNRELQEKDMCSEIWFMHQDIVNNIQYGTELKSYRRVNGDGSVHEKFAPSPRGLAGLVRGLKFSTQQIS